MPWASKVVDVNGIIVVEAVPHSDRSGAAFVAAAIAAMVKEKDVTLISLVDATKVNLARSDSILT
jgi:hypothetical protein